MRRCSSSLPRSSAACPIGSGGDTTVYRAGFDVSWEADLFGGIAYLLVILASLIIAFNSLGLTQVTDLLGKVLLFVPRLLVALLEAFGAASVSQHT